MTESTQTPRIMVQNISCILPQQSQLGALFLGNVYGAQNPIILKQYGIRAVLTSSIETDINYQFQDVPFHMKIEAHDKENYNLKEHINNCIDFIEKARQLTNVYVHCFAGVSRSAAIVCAYIMWKLKWNYETTMAFVKAKRIVAKPNQGFVRQLLQIQEIILGQSSYISKDQSQVQKSSSINSQVKNDSIAPKQLLQYKNGTMAVEKHQSRQLKNQSNIQQTVSSTLVNNPVSNKIQKNIENQSKIDQQKYVRNSFQSGSYTPERFQNAPILTSSPVNQTYQSTQAPVQKTEKTDRFLYLQNFFPQNHLTQRAPHNIDKAMAHNQIVVENAQKPRNNFSLGSTGQNQMKSPKDKQFYATSIQGFKNIQNQQNSVKNLMNPVLEKGVSSTSQLVLGGNKPTYSHNSIPVPKVLEKRQHQKSNDYLKRASELPPQTNNRTIMQVQQNYRASQGIEIMPKVNEYIWSGGNQQQKFSIRSILSEQNLKYPVNNNFYNKKFDFRGATTMDGVFNSKNTSQQKQSQKSTSRLLVRPKDLPGYKNY